MVAPVEFEVVQVGEMPAVVWRFGVAVCVLSSAAVGGGFATVDWIVNARVPIDYHREDLDVHAGEIATALSLRGAGVALFTAADVGKIQSSSADGVSVAATVGVSKPTWAADPRGSWSAAPAAPGTINIVAQLPVLLSQAAAVNAVITITEAKSQALFELGVAGTGTASDAVVVCWPETGAPELFAGPRSEWGSRLAIATCAAVRAGVLIQREST